MQKNEADFSRVWRPRPNDVELYVSGPMTSFLRAAHRGERWRTRCPVTKAAREKGLEAANRGATNSSEIKLRTQVGTAVETNINHAILATSERFRSRPAWGWQ